MTPSAVTALLGFVLATATYFVGRSIGRQQGLDMAFPAAKAAALAWVAAHASTDHHHCSALRQEVTILRLALAEANRRLADIGVTISVEEAMALDEIAAREQWGEQ